MLVAACYIWVTLHERLPVEEDIFPLVLVIAKFLQVFIYLVIDGVGDDNISGVGDNGIYDRSRFLFLFNIT